MEFWAIVLEQTMIVLIVIGRWFMPKGDLTRQQLSALLLSYLGTGCDIVDFLSLLSEPKAVSSEAFSYAILFVWTWSLCQFPFVKTLTTKKGDVLEDDQSEEEEFHAVSMETAGSESKTDTTVTLNLKKVQKLAQDFLETEAWGIFVTLILQDGPFATMRAFSILHFGVKTYTNYFFTTKNVLVLVLQIYRLVSIYSEHKLLKNEERETKTKESYTPIVLPDRT